MAHEVLPDTHPLFSVESTGFVSPGVAEFSRNVVSLQTEATQLTQNTK